ncbi:dimethyl sulfoxide reductase anchor subunit family protein [Salipiger aestuarii]|uniref:DMSO reductase anchor subunit n=1 Tax=Salipiger aestuarii TaxID=568098 RepID=A0A327YG45_9RHOB|nr:DmsC/YnfH family molybdoenzyme membrane anchor subunit [Salipiger aestuarii]KAA8612255.1 dibenzothiophene desulfurase [Salipiger aestuarii]KAB2541383.1 dibenzothiophene desulfurase [Salipiger aestuarii]RAK20038.1 DMSO reductase anchor subunit [Salipiger aestuarii]
MHPARSLIAFTTLSGLGFGLLAWLGIDPTPPTGAVAAAFYLVAAALALAGLGVSALHLRRPERAWRAFREWRTSWLSREAWTAALALALSGAQGLLLTFGTGLLPALGMGLAPLGWLAAAAALGTVLCTAMIYAQLATVPRWHHWSTPALFLALAITGGALLSGRIAVASVALALTGALQLWCWWDGDKRFARAGHSLATATGLGGIGTPRPLFPAHTARSYVMDEMVCTVGRRHARKLRALSLALMTVLPVVLLQLPMPHLFGFLALVSHVIGVFVSRWLFFAEAEHVSGLYYGRR